MRIILMAVVAFCVIVPALQAQGPQSVSAVQLWGDIVDNNSIRSIRPDEVTDFMRAYTKADALKPMSQYSGYSLYTGGRLIKFTQGSTSLIIDFLSRRNNDIHVIVTAKWYGDKLNVLWLKNR